MLSQNKNENFRNWRGLRVYEMKKKINIYIFGAKNKHVKNSLKCVLNVFSLYKAL